MCLAKGRELLSMVNLGIPSGHGPKESFGVPCAPDLLIGINCESLAVEYYLAFMGYLSIGNEGNSSLFGYGNLEAVSCAISTRILGIIDAPFLSSDSRKDCLLVRLRCL